MKYKVSEIAEIFGGGTPKTSVEEYWNGDIPWLSVKDFNNDSKYVYETEKTITKEGLDHSSTKMLKRGDIIISARGTVGEMAVIPFPMAFNQSCFGLRVKEDIVCSDYLYYSLKNDIRFLRTQTSGSVFDTITRKTFDNIEIDIPSIGQQFKMVKILNLIEEKIEINKHINKNLEALAEELFKSWFVDFSAFGGEMPCDWQTKMLKEIAKVSAGGDKPLMVSDTKSEECPYKIYSNGISNEGLYGFTNEAKIFDESVTVSARGTIGFVCLRHEPYVPIVRLISVIPYREVMTAKFLYLWLKQLHIEGTGTTQQQLTVPSFKNTQIIVPSHEIMARFDELIDPIFQKIWACQAEVEVLSAIRDTLLPKLISGQLDISKLSFER